jgi:hypothetical protein
MTRNFQKDPQGSWKKLLKQTRSVVDPRHNMATSTHSSVRIVFSGQRLLPPFHSFCADGAHGQRPRIFCGPHEQSLEMQPKTSTLCSDNLWQTFQRLPSHSDPWSMDFSAIAIAVVPLCSTMVKHSRCCWLSSSTWLFLRATGFFLHMARRCVQDASRGVAGSSRRTWSWNFTKRAVHDLISLFRLQNLSECNVNPN